MSQHNALVQRMDALEVEACDDVRALARLWQLQNKMESVGAVGTYGAWLCYTACTETGAGAGSLTAFC